MKTSAEVLEFESLRQLVGRYMSSGPGKRELEKLQPHDDRPRLEEDLAETAEAVEYLRLAARPQPAGRGAAIRVDFGGGANIELGQPAQYVTVESGRSYHFRGWIRTEEITTESGVRFLITDPNHLNAVNFTSDNLTGTHPWMAVDGEVTTGPDPSPPGA